MATTKKAVIYARVSTDSQTTENQTRELEAYAVRMGYRVVATLTDKGISGSKGKQDRPAYARLCEMICPERNRHCSVHGQWIAYHAA